MLKNYTSNVPMATTMANIEYMLVKHGATNMMKEFRDGTVAALTFRFHDPVRGEFAIRLPANVDAVVEVLRTSFKRPPKPEALRRIRDQAQRTAWKLMQDWIEVQLSLIQMKQAEFLQVFLPFMWDGKRTFFEAMKVSNFKMLPGSQQ